jgi:hypothetical protein
MVKKFPIFLMETEDSQEPTLLLYTDLNQSTSVAGCGKATNAEV